MSLDISKQMVYWLESGRENLEVAALLLKKGKVLEGLFFAHLALEKTLKAHVVKNTKGIPPRTHNLIRLAELGNITMDDKLAGFLGELTDFQLECRYPSNWPEKPSIQYAEETVGKVKEIDKWLRERLKL